jgi:hypothetical protein
MALGDISKKSGGLAAVLTFRLFTTFWPLEYGQYRGGIWRLQGHGLPSIPWVEDTLVKDGTGALPGKKVLKRIAPSIQYIVVDVTESPINRPKEGQKEYYSGKKAPYAEDSGHNRAGQFGNH